MSDRAVLFVDGNNWFHALKACPVDDVGRLDYAKISRKLAGARDWCGTRYYIGRVPQAGNRRLYADQRRFLSQLAATDRRITCHLGRFESRAVQDSAALELEQYLASLRARINARVYHDLRALAHRYAKTEVLIEKTVDVMLAVDMVVMAEREQSDTAYLLSADGDFTPAVDAIRSVGKRVFAVSPSYGAHLATAVDAFIRLDRRWFYDCYRR